MWGGVCLQCTNRSNAYELLICPPSSKTRALRSTWQTKNQIVTTTKKIGKKWRKNWSRRKSEIYLLRYSKARHIKPFHHLELAVCADHPNTTVHLRHNKKVVRGDAGSTLKPTSDINDIQKLSRYFYVCIIFSTSAISFHIIVSIATILLLVL